MTAVETDLLRDQAYIGGVWVDADSGATGFISSEVAPFGGMKVFLAKIQPLIHTQQNRILTPTSFSPLR